MWFQEPSDSGSPGQLDDSDALLTSIVGHCLVVAAWPTLLAWPYGWIGSDRPVLEQADTVGPRKRPEIGELE